MFRIISDRISRDSDYPDRAFTIEVYNRILEGAFYDHLPHGFHQEVTEAGEYVPLRDRRPSVQYRLCRLLVEDAVALLFSEGHFPTVECEDETAKEAFADIVKDLCLNERMLEAATAGSVGSVALHLRVLPQKDKTKFRAFVEINNTKFLTPTFDGAQPDTLLKLLEQYKVRGADLRRQGYVIKDDELSADFWFARSWDLNEETWYLPWKVKDENATPFERDAERSVTHNLGFVPWLWIRNLPGKLKLLDITLPRGKRDGGTLTYSDCDGACTFTGAIDAMIEIDYQLSQTGRGLKYSMDPLLMLREPAAPQDASFTKSPQNALIVSEKGDAKMLEIGGTAFAVVLDYVKALRELALEATHGNRTDPQKLATATSGRAMELMNQALIWLSDKMRVSYGEGALVALLKMVVAAHEKFPLTVKGKPLAKISPDVDISLRWPAWYAATADDRMNNATTLKTHSEAGHISQETAVKSIASDFDVEDHQAEIAKIKTDQKEALAREKELIAAKPKPKPAKAAKK